MKRRTIDWTIVLSLVVIHIGVVLAWWTWSLAGFIAMIILMILTGMFGICIGFHRLLTHQSFETYRPIRFLFAVLGSLSGEGSAIFWTAMHRKHHQHSDTQEDPHSPHAYTSVLKGFWWSHLGWILIKDHGEFETILRKYAPKHLFRAPEMQFLHLTFPLWHLLPASVLAGIGWWLDGMSGMFSLLVWGMLVRMFVVLHATWLVNSATHLWGYQTYETGDQSRNNWWVALMTFGEGWHNNHHADQLSARHGHKWWEVDLSFMTIIVMKWCGLAWNVKLPRV